MSAADVVARERELVAIDCVLDGLVEGPRALVLEGEPGIGKTTVWEQVFARAKERSLRTLACRPVEAEAKLAFASLGDLLAPVDAHLVALPEPQRQALEVALLRVAPGRTAPTPRTVGTAVRSLLGLLAAEAPVVVAIDDIQWLDRPSAASLAFALRRLGDAHVGVVTALRLGKGVPLDPLALDPVERLRLAPLSLGALHHVIRSQLDHVFPRPTLQRIAKVSGGNPLFALELGRGLRETGARPGPGDPLPIPERLDALMRDRIGRLPARTRTALLAAASLATPTTELVQQAFGSDMSSALERAERAGVVELRGGQIRFDHPLLAAAVVARADNDERTCVHRRLAEVAPDEEERALHLALATTERHETVAARLDVAAARARARGAPDAAGELLERAARLTPADEVTAIASRLTRAAEHFLRSGDRGHARALLEKVLAAHPAGLARGEALRLLAEVRYNEDSFPDAIRHLEEALLFLEDPESLVAATLDLAFACKHTADFAGAHAHVRSARDRAAQIENCSVLAHVFAIGALHDFTIGKPFDEEQLKRAVSLDDGDRPGPLVLRPRFIAASLASFQGRLRESACALYELREWAIERGEDSELPFLLGQLVYVEHQRGELEAAARLADEAVSICGLTTNETMLSGALADRAYVRAVLGDVASARADLDQSRMLAERVGWAYAELYVPWVACFLELSLGNSEAAAQALDVVDPAVAAHPSNLFALPDATEALVATGALERGEQLLKTLEGCAREVSLPPAAASAARCRASLLAAHGDLDGALAAAEEALRGHERLEMPLERGRTLLELGRIRRRNGERRAARDALAQAVQLFEQLPAPLWAERAAEELRRIPIRRGASDELTPTERQVAELAAAGHTNRAVAQALFISPKTVEANLARVYRKLGIRSRAELGAHAAASLNAQQANA
jgi:DNA-binding CsgD family transcriptional regulator